MRHTGKSDAHAALVRSASFVNALDAGHTEFSPGMLGVWRRRPLVLAALSLLAGDITGLSGQIPLWAWELMAALAAVTALLGVLIGKPRVWLLLICMLMLGGLMGASVMTAPDTPPEGECYLTGRVLSVRRDDAERLVVDIDRVTADGDIYQGRMRLTLYRPRPGEDGAPVDMSLPEGFETGAYVSLFGETYLPQGARGEGGFDYRAYLMRRGVYSCGSGELAGARFEPTGELRLLDMFRRMRAYVADALDAELGAHAAAARGIMLGDSDALPDDVYDSFRMAGMSHILAVSGMHVSFMVTLLGWALALLPGRLRAAIMALALVAYCGLAGFSVSVVRACVMGLVMLGARLTGVRYEGPSALALAAIVIIAAAPGAALDTGFALTFGAVLSIYALYPGLRERLPRVRFRARTRLRNRSMRKLEAAARRLLNGACNGLIDSAALSVCVTAGLLPLTSAYFGQVNIMSIVTSPAGILAGMGVLCTGWLTVLLHGWAQPLAGLAAGAARLCARAAQGVAEWTAGIDWGILYMRAISPWWLLVIAPLMLYASRYRPLSRGLRATSATLALGLIAVLLLPPWAGSGLSYVQVDVGQGDGALFTDGAQAVVVDVGSEGSALPDYVRRRGLRVNALIITHLHEDHAGALTETVRVARAGRVYLPENAEAGADEEALVQLNALIAEGLEVVRLRAGDVLEPIEGLELTVLHPGAAPEFEAANDYSLVLRAEYAGRALLLTGDLTTAGEDFVPEECDMLKVAHHGSAGSSSLEFLAAANPKLALISASEHNSYGLPSEELLARLDYLDIEALTTAQCGDITVHISPEGDMTARTYIAPADQRESDTIAQAEDS